MDGQRMDAEQAHRKAAEAHRADRNAQRAADEVAHQWEGEPTGDQLHESWKLEAKARETNRAAQQASKEAANLYPLDDCARLAIELAANESGEPFSAPSADLAAEEHDRLANLAAKHGTYDDDRR